VSELHFPEILCFLKQENSQIQEKRNNYIDLQQLLFLRYDKPVLFQYGFSAATVRFCCNSQICINLFTLSLKNIIFSDKSLCVYMNKKSSQKILSRIYGRGRGAVFTPKDFHDLATPETVRQTLSRLAETGKIRRLLRGVYDYPVFSSLFQAPASPDPDAIAQAIARTHGWTILPSGETALNMLGLTTQVPARYQYFSDGPARKYNWEGGSLELIHRANRETTVLSPSTALLVQALKTLGRARIDDAVIKILRTRLTARERSLAGREGRYVTSWVYELIKRLAMD